MEFNMGKSKVVLGNAPQRMLDRRPAKKVTIESEIPAAASITSKTYPFRFAPPLSSLRFLIGISMRVIVENTKKSQASSAVVFTFVEAGSRE